uniref:Uncharacterized protein n=1 Tax=Mucochytrium quahogii TaxID=96639 RepID=A0A7S2WGF7_9STRA
MFGGAIATKMADGLRHAQKHGFFSLGDSLDFSGTTSILCEFNEEEKICFNEVAKAITEIDAVKAFIDDGMPLKENSNRKYTLDEMVSVGLSLKDEVCVFLEDLGNLTFTNIVLNSARAIRIVDKLNAFPVIGPLVPTFGDECVQAATNVASYAVGDNSIEKICGISESESRCLIDIGRKLDGITFVQMMFESLTTTTYTTIQASIEDILLKALPGACGLMDDIGLGMERNSISGFMGKIPEFLKSLEIFSELPILKSFAPKLSESCNKTLSSFAKNVANAKGELQGVMQVCIHYKAHGDGVPNCLLEMNDKFEAVEFIGEHIPDGIVKAFVDSVPIGCDLLNQDAAADRTAFLGDDLPVLLRAVGFLAGVEETCREQVVSKAKDSKLCEVDETCMENYIDASMSIPLVGRFVPSWTRDLVIDLCAVKNGGATMKEFINTHLGNIMGKIAEIPGIDSQCKDAVKIAANITGVDRFKQICLKLGEYDCTLQTVAALSQLPVAKDVIPPGTDKLIQVSCGYLTDTSGTATVFDLVPHLAPLMQVLGLFLGYPSDTCGEQLIAVTEKLSQVEKFDTGIFCSGLSSVCTSEVVQSFSGLPMVGGYLPKGSDQLIGASCALYKDRNDYATSMDHLSTLFDLLGKLVDGPYLQLDKGCKEKIKLHLFDRDNEFQPKMLCEIGVCKTQLIDALQRLPLAGEYVPDSAIELLNDMCSIQERSGAKGALLLTEDLEDKRGLPRTLPEILAIFGRLVSSKAAEGSGRRLDEVKCGKKLTEYGESQEAFTIESFCSEIPEECMPIVLESLEKIPLLKQFIPERTGELITTSCALKRANGNVRTLIRDSLPSLLAIVISPAVIQNMKTLDGVCKSPLHEVGALFKSKGGIVCGRELCAGVEQACIESFAESLQGLTFAGNYVPDDLVYALKNTCKLIRSAPEFKGYYEDTRADMFHMTSLLASGFAPSCVQPLAVATTSNDLCKNSKCVDDFVSSLDSAVLIGKHLPDWVKPMYSNICAATGRSPETFPVFVNNTLPQAFSVAGGVFEHNTACTYQVKSFGKSCGTTGIVPLERLCHMQASCFTELKKTLGTLPLWGTLIPGNTMSYLDTICTIFQDTARGELTETSKVSKFLQGGLVQILKELIQLQSSGVITEEHCIPSYSAAVDKIDTESICKTIPIDCLRSFIGFSRDYTIYDQYVPKDFDVLVLNICPISNAEDPVNYILSNKLIPDLAFQLETFSTGRAVCDAKKTISDMCADETCVGDFVNAFANLPLLNGTLSDQQKANLTTQLKTRNCVVDQGSQDSGTMPPTNVTKAAKATSTVVIVGSVIGSIAALTLILVLVKLYLSTRKGKDDESRLDLDQALSVVPNMNSAPITHLTSEDARAVEPDSESSDEDESPFGAGGGHTATIRNN